LSFARVLSGGPFSLYAGMARILAVWEGDGLSLERNGQRIELEPLTPFGFLGDDAITSELRHGPITDFNVIYDPAAIRAECAVIAVAEHAELSPFSGEERFLVCVRGAFTCGSDAIAPGDALRPGSSSSLRVSGAGVLFDVRLTATTPDAGSGNH
jgi:environmental stress-induced protein Ves